MNDQDNTNKQVEEVATQEAIDTYTNEELKTLLEQAELQTDEDGQQYYDVAGNVFLLVDFAGDKLKGLKYFTRNFTDYDAMIKALGSDKVMDLVNDQMNASIKSRVRNSCIPRYADEVAQKKAVADLLENKPIVFSEQDALGFMPGEREMNANAYMSQAKKLMKEGKNKEARAAMKKAMELLMQDDDDEDEDEA